jgi:hypothetical protein
MVVAEGVAPPEDVDRMWQLFVGAGVPPFRLAAPTHPSVSDTTLPRGKATSFTRSWQVSGPPCWR